LYPDAHELNIAENTNSYEIFMKICLEEMNDTEKDIKAETIVYAME